VKGIISAILFLVLILALGFFIHIYVDVFSAGWELWDELVH
jgi:hypothetical protein